MFLMEAPIIKISNYLLAIADGTLDNWKQKLKKEVG
jgi:hypothetical protein